MGFSVIPQKMCAVCNSQDCSFIYLFFNILVLQTLVWNMKIIPGLFLLSIIQGVITANTLPTEISLIIGVKVQERKRKGKEKDLFAFPQVPCKDTKLEGVCTKKVRNSFQYTYITNTLHNTLITLSALALPRRSGYAAQI